VARRIVCDTNVLISGYLWRGATRRLLDVVRTGRQWTLLNSSDTMNEFIRVLAYPKFGLTPAEIEPLVVDLRQHSMFVHVRSNLQIIQEDPTDNIFLNLAVDGKAELLVSGDHHLLNLKTLAFFMGTTVRFPRVVIENSHELFLLQAEKLRRNEPARN
jgi:putative PIN family toxin of toxin-antitoxin system